MFNGLKARRRLAVYVALGLSAGSCTCLDASSAYAAHDYTETATSISGLEGTDKTNSMSDNNITIGTPGTPNVPFSTWGTISGGGKQNTTADVTGNTLTIHGLRVSNGSGHSVIYGGISGTGAVTNNKVFFNNGLSKDPIYGGFNGASATKAVTGNAVTVAGGTVEGDAFGGVTQGTGAVTGNSVTITGGTLKDEAAGGVVTNASNSADITGNTLTISGGAFTKSGGTKVFGAYTAGSGKAENNSATVGGIDNTNLNVYGAYAAGAGNAVNNHVTITGTGKVGGVYAGRAQSAAGKAERNTVTIEPGGWAENNVFGGYAKGGVKGNIVNIKGTVNATAYGGRLMGSGTAEANEVHLEDATVKNQVIGAEGDDGALVKENRISVAKSLVKEDVIGGFSRGTTGKAEGNTVSVTGDSARVKGTVTGAMRQGTRRPLGIRLASRKGRLKETSMEATACKTVRLRVIQQVFRAVY